ncbi:MAG: hypothetical protein DSY92_09730, partial [Planctomycetota bacterium]
MDIVSLGGETAAPDADHGFDAETFKEFISFDVGDGDPIYYHSVGKLYRQPGGEIIAGVEALVSNRLVKMEGNQAEAICRTLVIYRDPDSGEILQQDDGSHIIREYPYISARFELKDRHLVIHTEGLSGPHQNGLYGLARVSNDKVFAQRSGDTTFFYWTLYGEVETPIGKVWFNEAYNGSTAPGVPDVMVMNRYGTLPAFAGMGDGFMQTTAARIDSYEQLPEQLREYVEKHAPSHCAPPVDNAEIDRLKQEYLGDHPPEAPKSAAPEQLSKEQIAEVVGGYFSCLRNMQVDELLELFSDDALSWDPVGTPPLLVRDKSTNYFKALSGFF